MLSIKNGSWSLSLNKGTLIQLLLGTSLTPTIVNSYNNQNLSKLFHHTKHFSLIKVQVSKARTSENGCFCKHWRIVFELRWRLSWLVLFWEIMFLMYWRILKIVWKYRSSRSRIFFKIDVLKEFPIFTGKYLCWSLFLVKLQGWRLWWLLLNLKILIEQKKKKKKKKSCKCCASTKAY